MADRTVTIPEEWSIGAADAPGTPTPGVTYRNSAITSQIIEDAWAFATVVNSADINEVLGRVTNLLRSIESYGILPWAAVTDYPIGARVTGSDGNVYRSLQNPNLNKQPTSQVAYWALTLDSKKGATVASANALPLISDGNYVRVTGTTNITSMASVGIGKFMTLRFTDTLTITHHATNLILPDGNDIITQVGDMFTFVEDATGNWRLLTNSRPYQLNKLTFLSGPSSPPLANTLVKDNIVKGWVYFDGSDGSILDSYNVSGVVRNGAGDYTVSWDRDFANVNYVVIATADAAVGDGFIPRYDNKIVGSVDILTVNSAANADDAVGVCVMAIGDQ